MLVVKELLKMGLNRTLESGQVHRLVYQYKGERVTANICSWRTPEGAKARLFANDLETKLMPIINALANIDSSLYYPTRVEDGKSGYLTILDRDGMYKYLIKLVEGETDGKK